MSDTFFEDISKKRQGRPKGSRNVAVQFKHYKPKRWEPWMEALVLASIQGKTNKELAESFGISLPHVSNILSTEQAAIATQKIRDKVSELHPDVSIKIGRIKEKAVQRIENFLDNDAVAEASPIAYISQVKDIMKMTFPKMDDAANNITNIQQNNILVANSEYLERLNEGLKTSNEVNLLHEEKRLKLLKSG
jgi:hypothetical protein